MHGVTKPKPFPETSWTLALVGGLALGYGYYRSATTTAQDIGNDLLIVAPLIIVGTYFLFTQQVFGY
ncbi:hypothetical protein [Bacillus sp. JCM 19041]|uniref:hypothetical protein n=1 Tax=Bacillus sp. JCM 19041 TaxID=1460637 RepID=UPI0006D0803B